VHCDGQFVGEIVLTEPLGVETILHIRSGTQKLLSIVPGMSGLCIGEGVRFDLVSERLHFFRHDGTRVVF
ncbi:MAG: hypothetical protein ACP5SI_06750, partial [Chloroflexia bacterium]